MFDLVFLSEFRSHCPVCETFMDHGSQVLHFVLPEGAFSAPVPISRCTSCETRWSNLEALFALFERTGRAVRRARAVEEVGGTPFEVGVWPDEHERPLPWAGYRSAYLEEGELEEPDWGEIRGDGFPLDPERVSLAPARVAGDGSSDSSVIVDTPIQTARGRRIEPEGYVGWERAPYFLQHPQPVLERFFEAAHYLHWVYPVRRFEPADRYLGVRLDEGEWSYLALEGRSFRFFDDWLQLSIAHHNPSWDFSWDPPPEEPDPEPGGPVEEVVYRHLEHLHPADVDYLERISARASQAYTFALPRRRSIRSGPEPPSRSIREYTRIFEALGAVLEKRSGPISTMNRSERTPEGPVRLAFPARGYEDIAHGSCVRLTVGPIGPEAHCRWIEVDVPARSSLHEVAYAIQRAEQEDHLWVKSFWQGGTRLYLHGLAGPVVAPRAGHLLGLDDVCVVLGLGTWPVAAEPIPDRTVRRPEVRLLV